jgi:hypothetical protein
VKVKETALVLFSLCGVGVFSVFTLLRSEGLIASDNCVARLSEAQIRSIIFSEMQKRQVVPNSIATSQLDNGPYGKLEIRLNDQDPNDQSNSEYGASMYLIQFLEGDLRFWALLSSCGQVNMAGTGKLVFST